MSRCLDSKKRSSESLHRKKSAKTATHLSDQTNIINLNPDQWLLPQTREYLIESEQKKKGRTIIEYRDEEEGEVVSTPQKEKTPTHYDEVESYLKKNSLISKGLTIFDVLYPVSVEVKEPKHVQVIDRYVLSKVWDDLLPLMYGSSAKKFRLVNHYAVDLENYELKLKDLLTEYHLFLGKFIWKCLSDDEKRILAPRLYWLALSNEDQYKYAQEITREEQQNQTALELFAWRKLSDDEQNKLLQKPAIYHERTQIVLKNALKNDKAESCLEGVFRMDVEIKRGMKFLQISTDLRQLQKRTGNESKQKPEPKLLIRRTPSARKRMGQRVMCRYDADGYFYPGSVQKDQNGRLIVLFDMNIEQDCVGRALLPMDSSSNQLSLFLNDCVIVRQMSDNEEYWAPGLILCLPLPYTSPGNVYVVQVHDPVERLIFVQRRDMTRISTTLFQRSVLYIQSIGKKPVNFRSVILDEPDIDIVRVPTSSSEPDFSTLIHDLINPLTEKIDHFNELHNERCQELQTSLKEQMAAIRLLQQQPNKPHAKGQYSQTISVQKPVKNEPDPENKREKPSKLDPIERSITSGTLARPDSKEIPIAVLTLSQSGLREIPVVVETRAPRIEPGTRVFAVWSDDDGLVYESIIVEFSDSNHYIVERTDFRGIRSTIPVEDIFLRSKVIHLQDLGVKSFVLLKYPDDSRQCFAPAIVQRHGTHATVCFHNCLEVSYDGDQIAIPISKEQFQRYTTLRIEKETSLIGQVTVGLYSKKKPKTFMLGTIIERVAQGDTYKIRWVTDEESEQKEEHLLGAFTRRGIPHVHDYVLAMDDKDSIYKAARVLRSLPPDDKINGLRLEVEFIENDRSTSRKGIVAAVTTFVITELYYNKIIKPL